MGYWRCPECNWAPVFYAHLGKESMEHAEKSNCRHYGNCPHLKTGWYDPMKPAYLHAVQSRAPAADGLHWVKIHELAALLNGMICHERSRGGGGQGPY